MSYIVPAPYTGMSTRSAHLVRRPPSTEPGTDYYMPIGTPLVAPADCVVVAIGGGVQPATGRFVLLDDGTRWLRALHLSRFEVNAGDQLRKGRDVFGLSGASGYGSEFFGASNPNDPGMLARTGGPHVHMTAFRGRGYTFGAAGTVDFHALTGGTVAGDGPSAQTPTGKDDDMRVMKAPDRNPALLAAGYFRELNTEEASNMIWPIIEVNDRQYDLNRAAAIGAVITSPATGGMLTIEDNAGSRPVALIGPGYYRALNAEERANVSVLANRHVVGNTRQYDLWVSLALSGQAAKS